MCLPYNPKPPRPAPINQRCTQCGYEKMGHYSFVFRNTTKHGWTPNERRVSEARVEKLAWNEYGWKNRRYQKDRRHA